MSLSVGDMQSVGTNGWFINTAAADYPAVGDVEEGVVFNNTNSTGTFAVPAEGDVVSLVGYGEDGTEFTGSFVRNTDVVGVVVGVSGGVGTIIGVT